MLYFCCSLLADASKSSAGEKTVLQVFWYLNNYSQLRYCCRPMRAEKQLPTGAWKKKGRGNWTGETMYKNLYTMSTNLVKETIELPKWRAETCLLCRQCNNDLCFNICKGYIDSLHEKFVQLLRRKPAVVYTF